MDKQVQDRLQSDTRRRYTMDCADCCKASNYDEDFFCVAPCPFMVNLDPATPGTRVTTTRVAYRLVDAQRHPSLDTPSSHSTSQGSYEGRLPDIYEQ